jgi:ketopantoate reductase
MRIIVMGTGGVGGYFGGKVAERSGFVVYRKQM